MKNQIKYGLIALSVLFVLGIVSIAAVYADKQARKMPFKYLELNRIESITLQKSEKEAYELEEGEKEKLVKILNKIIISEEDNIFGGLCNFNGSMFNIKIKNGKTIHIKGFQYCIFIDESCYKTDSSETLEISVMYNNILNKL